MVKISGTQNIPSEIYGLYKQSLTEQGNNGFCKKRSPFRLPNMQAGGKHVRVAQVAQRLRFIQAVKQFNQTDQTERERWYERAPIWNSFLWYYDYFMMSALSGAVSPDGKVEAVIKSIQVLTEEIPIIGGKTYTITEVDPTRTIVLVFGNSFISDNVQRGSSTVNQNSTVNIALSPSVDPLLSEVKIQGQKGEADPGGEGDWLTPYVTALTASQLTIGLDSSSFVSSCKFSWEIIERKSQTIYPLPTEILATSAKIEWSKEPSVPADVSIIVVEYI